MALTCAARTPTTATDGAPATLQPSGSLLYAAPSIRGEFPGPSGTSASVLFEVAPGRVDAHRLGDVEPVWAPIVRAEGVLFTLARAENDVLVLRPVDSMGHALADQRLGVQVPGAYSAPWDLSHQQLLRVVPVVQTHDLDRGSLTVVSLEIYADAFLVHTHMHCGVGAPAGKATLSRHMAPSPVRLPGGALRRHR